jgi:protein tyrosine/serine phosphatase
MNPGQINPFHSGKVVFAAALALAVWLVFPQASWSKAQDSGNGLENFGKVTDQLFRGAQPTAAGFAALQKMGVAIVVNFRDERDEQSVEQREVENLGIKYVGIPWSGSDYPSNSQVLQFLDLVHANPTAKIFVHCKRGADRTGVMVAAYRIAVEHKVAADAIAEMHQFHYDHFFLPQLQRYIASLPQLLKTDPAFIAYGVAPNIAPPSATAALAAAASAATRAAAIVPAP